MYRLCVVIIVESELELSPEMYTHIETDEFLRNNLQFTYITKNTQNEFLKSFINAKSDAELPTYDHKVGF